MQHSFSATNKLTQVLNNRSTVLMIRLDTSSPVQVQFPQSDISKFCNHDYIGSSVAGSITSAHGYITVDNQIMWFDNITNVGGMGQFLVTKRGINQSPISHSVNAPIEMRATRQHLLQIQGFLTSISRSFSTSGNSVIDLSNPSYGFEYAGSQYNIGNLLWNGMTAATQNITTQFYDNGTNLFPKNNRGLTATQLSIGGNTTVNSLSRSSFSIGGLRKDLNWDNSYNIVQSGSATWYAGVNLPSSSNWNSNYNTVQSYSSTWRSAYLSLLGNSATWNNDNSILFSSSANWNSVNQTVFSTSRGWNSRSATLQSNSASWNSTSRTLNSNSATWGGDHNILLSYSAGWNSGTATLNSNSRTWQGDHNVLLSNSRSWNSTSRTLNSNSANWNNTYSVVNSSSSNWNSAYNTYNSNSASYLKSNGSVRIASGIQSIANGASLSFWGNAKTGGSLGGYGMSFIPLYPAFITKSFLMMDSYRGVYIGDIRYNGWNSTLRIRSQRTLYPSILIESIQTTTASQFKVFDVIENNTANKSRNLNLYQNNISKIRFNSQGDSYFNGGNVGIGTTAFSSQLTIQASTNDSNGAIKILGHSHLTDVNYWNENQFSMQYNGVNTNLINSIGNSYFNGGNVGIGTLSPKYLLDISGNSSAVDGVRAIIQNSYTGRSYSLASLLLTRNNNSISAVIAADNYGYWSGGDKTAVMGTMSNHSLNLITNNTSRFQIGNDGSVNIYNGLTVGTNINAGDWIQCAGSASIVTTDYVGPRGHGSGLFFILSGLTGGNRYSSIYSTSAGNILPSDMILQQNGGKVGIGSTHPGQILQIVGNVRLSGSNARSYAWDGTYARSNIGIGGSNSFLNLNNSSGVTTVAFLDNGYNYINSGYLGIGTTAAANQLQVYGQGTGHSIQFDVTGTYARIRLIATSPTASTLAVFDKNSGGHLYFGEGTDTGSYIFRGNNSVRGMSILTNTTPSCPLDVRGVVKASGGVIAGPSGNALMCIVLAGTTSSIRSLSVPHGLTRSKIVSVNVLIGNDSLSWIPPNTTYTNSNYRYYVSTSNVTITNMGSNLYPNIPYVITIYYTA